MDQSSFNTKKVLIVDDEPNILELYSEVLSEAGFAVEIANNGNEALQKLENSSFDLVLLDIMMNDGPDGIECLKIIKSNKQKFKNPIVVMLTNLALTNNIKEAFDSGAEGYLIKLTLSNAQLVNKVQGYLRGFSG